MTDLSHLESVIEAAWDNRAEVSPAAKGEVRDAVESALALLDSSLEAIFTEAHPVSADANASDKIILLDMKFA